MNKINIHLNQLVENGMVDLLDIKLIKNEKICNYWRDKDENFKIINITDVSEEEDEFIWTNEKKQEGYSTNIRKLH